MAIEIITTPPVRAKDLTGKTFGYLSVLGWTMLENRTIWVCKCKCGKERTVWGGNLTKGNSMSCGCMFKGVKNVTHGMSYHKFYILWRGIKTRCEDKNSKSYKDYGARGIKITEPWRSSFDSFVKDMWPSYKDGLTIDRIDNDGDYCKENCRWVTRSEQALNKRTNLVLELNGIKMPAVQWARKFGINNKTLHMRLKHGWSISDALKTPVQWCGRRSSSSYIQSTIPDSRHSGCLEQNNLNPNS